MASGWPALRMVPGYLDPVSSLCQYLLIRGYQGAARPLKTLIFYLIIATVVGYVGALTNYFLWFGVKVLPVGNIAVTFYVIIFTYAIIRYRVLNINIIKTEGLLFLIFFRSVDRRSCLLTVGASAY